MDTSYLFGRLLYYVSILEVSLSHNLKIIWPSSLEAEKKGIIYIYGLPQGQDGIN